MYAVIYKFEVNKNKEEQFIESWIKLTELIFQYEGSLGSRLHKENDNTYIAYAQWSSKRIWEKSGNNLPEYANEIRLKMRESCLCIKKIYEMECVQDLLKQMKTCLQ